VLRDMEEGRLAFLHLKNAPGRKKKKAKGHAIATEEGEEKEPGKGHNDPVKVRFLRRYPLGCWKEK